MILKNCELENFKDHVLGKKIICFGAGVSGQIFAKRFGYAVLAQIQFFIDNDKEKWGKEINIEGGGKYLVKSPSVLSTMDLNNTIILITSRFWDQIHAQLEAISSLKEVECYIYLLMKANGSKEKYIIPEGPDIIPKKIHYCWFGGKAMSENEIKCMESWKKFCPDYEIIRWDEKNYDCQKTRYLQEVYDYGHYSAVSSYARFEILNEVGGIYLDTDVEIIKNIDELLRLPAFMGFEVSDTINTGIGFGASKGNGIYKEIVEYYDAISHFNEKGEFYYIGCPTITTNVLQKHGLICDGSMQKVEGITIFPNDYFDPVMQVPVENTYSIHRYSSLWSLKGMNMTKIWAEQRRYWEKLKRSEMIMETIL